MSFKKFSSEHNSPVNDSPDDKSTHAPAADQAGTQPDKKPADAAPARKS